MTDLCARRQTLRVDHFRDSAAFRDYFKKNYGPTISTYRSLAGDPERTAALDRDLLDLAARHDCGKRGDGLGVPAADRAQAELTSAPAVRWCHTCATTTPVLRRSTLLRCATLSLAIVARSSRSTAMNAPASSSNALTLSFRLATAQAPGHPRRRRGSAGRRLRCCLLDANVHCPDAG